MNRVKHERCIGRRHEHTSPTYTVSSVPSEHLGVVELHCLDLCMDSSDAVKEGGHSGIQEAPASNSKSSNESMSK